MPGGRLIRMPMRAARMNAASAGRQAGMQGPMNVERSAKGVALGVNLSWATMRSPPWAKFMPSFKDLKEKYLIDYVRTPVYADPKWKSAVYDPAVKDKMPMLGILMGDFIWAGPGAPYKAGWTLDDWNSAVQAAVEQYPEIHIWEVWNEPGLYGTPLRTIPQEKGYFMGDAGNYLEMLKSAYGIIKKHSSSDTVIGLGGAGLFRPNNYVAKCETDFAQSVCGNGGLNFMDAISVHAYTAMQHLLTEGHSWSSETLAQVWSNNLDAYEKLAGKPIWVTEVGLPSNDTDQVKGMSPEMQARFMNQALNLLLSKQYVKSIMWWNLMGPSKMQRDFGLIDYTNGTVKPAMNEMMRFKTEQPQQQQGTQPNGS